MSNKKTPKKVDLATAMPGEPSIPQGLLNKYKQQVKEQEEKKNDLISSPEKSSSGSKKGSLESKDVSDTIGTSVASTKPSAKAGQKKPTVAVYSDRNVSWIGVGKISKGYNIVTKEQSEKWLTRNHVREATPEEVASQFGV
jgi:hypothetical protein